MRNERIIEEGRGGGRVSWPEETSRRQIKRKIKTNREIAWRSRGRTLHGELTLFCREADINGWLARRTNSVG